MKNLPSPLISAIVAMAENRVIGKNNQLPWRLPADLKHFKAITTGHLILMGRKTYESIGRPLPNRLNVIITRDNTLQAPGCVVVTSFEEALQQAASAKQHEIFIIGGASVYQQLLPYVQRLYLTIIHDVIDGDTYFPLLNQEDWQEIERKPHTREAENPYDYSFLIWDRISRT
jgi:dihydrofolate reductase